MAKYAGLHIIHTHAAMMAALLSVLAGSALAQAPDEPNPPTWPGSVRVFTPEDTDINETVYAAFANNGGMCSGAAGPDCPPGQWSGERYAFLFMPGHYAVDVPVGFYTTVAGAPLHPSLSPLLPLSAGSLWT